MLKIKIVSVGKIKEKSLKSLIDEYVKRLGRYAKTEMIELADLPVPGDADHSGTRRKNHHTEQQ